MEALVDAELNTERQLVNTVPTTLAGLAAFSDFVDAESEHLGEFVFLKDRIARLFARSMAQSARTLVTKAVA
jgi:hypothetical protein